MGGWDHLWGEGFSELGAGEGRAHWRVIGARTDAKESLGPQTELVYGRDLLSLN